MWGEKIQFCTECGDPLKPGDNFCRKCGTVLKKEPPSPEPDQEPPKASPIQKQGLEEVSYQCQTCGSKLRFMSEYGKYWCDRCNKYIDDTQPVQYSPEYVKPVYVATIIFSLIGGIMFLAFDFAKWYNYNHYYRSREWGIIGPSTSPLATIIFFLAACALFYCTVISLRGLTSKQPLSRAFVGSGIAAALFLFLIIAIGAAVFFITSDATSTWLETGFYGGAIGSFLTAILLWINYRTLPVPLPKTPVYPPGYYPNR